MERDTVFNRPEVVKRPEAMQQEIVDVIEKALALGSPDMTELSIEVAKPATSGSQLIYARVGKQVRPLAIVTREGKSLRFGDLRRPVDFL